MQDYDSALKLALRQPARRAIEQIGAPAIAHWLDAELPKSQNLRMDLLGEDADGHLHQFELQSTNFAQINLRMAEYSLGILRITGKFPRQVVLYVGEAPLNMPSKLRGPDTLHRYRVIDIRTLDGDALLASEDMGDNLIAILARLRDHKEAVRAIVAKIATCRKASGTPPFSNSWFCPVCGGWRIQSGGR